MNTIQIYGGRRLSGCVRIGGTKNAALPILFATILTGGVSIVSNLPSITDVSVALALLSELGDKVEYLDTDTVLDPEVPVSMNFWGFSPSIFPLMREYFEAFLQSDAGQSRTSECLLPVMVDALMKQDAAKYLNVEGTLAENSVGSLADSRERIGENIVQRLTRIKTRAKNIARRAKLLLRHNAVLVRQRLNRICDRLNLFYLSFTVISEE